ncbi:MAG: SPOR domain-containing protein, partial [Tannerellaceae bacterium]|nr:SPOR domain-containing protein [Tannerellaceae bacterium]
MLRIVPHLERLLMVQDFVTVPQLGGFVLQTVSASCQMNDHSFHPTHKEITFNTTIRHNDGLLVESYTTKYGVDYQHAYRMLKDDISEITEILSKGMNVSLGAIGTFRNGREGEIIFRPTETNLFSTESYGLASFQLKTLHALQREEEEALLAAEKKARKDTFYIPVNRKVLRGIASVAAAITLFLIISTPVKDIDAQAYTASFIPVDMVSASTRVTSKPATGGIPAPANHAPQYYVIVSSVNTTKQANEYLASMNRSVFKRADILTGGNKIRIYANKFNSREKASA